MFEPTPFAGIDNPEARLGELEARLRYQDDASLKASLVEALCNTYPPLQRFAAEELSVRLTTDLSRAFEALATGRTPEFPNSSKNWITAFEHLTPAPGVRQLACLILKGSTTDTAVGALLEAVKDSDPNVRYRALKSLYTKDVAPARLKEIVSDRLDDDDPEVSLVASQIIAQNGWTEFGSRLIELFGILQGRNKFQIAISLAELSGEHELELPADVRERLTETCIEALDDSRTVSPAADALVQLDTAEAAKARLEKLIDGWFTHPILKVDAAFTLLRIGADRGHEYFAEVLESGRKDARGHAIQLTGRHNIEQFKSQIAEIARADEYHTDTAIEALAESGPEGRQQVAELAQTHTNPQMRCFAEQTLESQST